MNSFADYKAKTASRYVPVSPGLAAQKMIESDYYLASEKYDGHMGILEIREGTASLYNRSGVQLDVPQILKSAAAVKENTVLAGEICFFKDGAAGTHREVSSALASPQGHDLRFAVFDVLEYRGAPAPSDIREKAALIKSLSPGGAVFAVEQTEFTSRKDVVAFYESIADRAEGIVVRIPGGLTYKIKPVITLDLVILGYAEAAGEREGMLRELLLGFALGSSRFLIAGKCGTGFSEEDRVKFARQFIKSAVPSEFTEVSGAKTAFIMIKPELVAEISCSDIISETSQGPVRKAELIYDKDKGYLNPGISPAVSLISPVFVRIRTDKKADERDAGTAQAYDLVSPSEEKSGKEDMPLSKIIAREVFVKKGKDGVSVRKFTGLKTDKEASGLYPAFAVVYTDFSTGRKTPLEQEVFLCAGEKEMRSKIEELKKAEIKKGWEALV